LARLAAWRSNDWSERPRDRRPWLVRAADRSEFIARFEAWQKPAQAEERRRLRAETANGRIYPNDA
jgi:hypothetical protein